MMNFKQQAEKILETVILSAIQQGTPSDEAFDFALTALEELHKAEVEKELFAIANHDTWFERDPDVAAVIDERLAELREQLKGKDNV